MDRNEKQNSFSNTKITRGDNQRLKTLKRKLVVSNTVLVLLIVVCAFLGYRLLTLSGKQEEFIRALKNIEEQEDQAQDETDIVISDTESESEEASQENVKIVFEENLEKPVEENNFDATDISYEVKTAVEKLITEKGISDYAFYFEEWDTPNKESLSNQDETDSFWGDASENGKDKLEGSYDLMKLFILENLYTLLNDPEKQYKLKEGENEILKNNVLKLLYRRTDKEQELNNVDSMQSANDAVNDILEKIGEMNSDHDIENKRENGLKTVCALMENKGYKESTLLESFGNNEQRSEGAEQNEKGIEQDAGNTELVNVAGMKDCVKVFENLDNMLKERLQAEPEDQEKLSPFVKKLYNNAVTEDNYVFGWIEEQNKSLYVVGMIEENTVTIGDSSNGSSTGNDTDTPQYIFGLFAKDLDGELQEDIAGIIWDAISKEPQAA